MAFLDKLEEFNRRVITEEELRMLPPTVRLQMGLPPRPMTRAQLFADSLLPRWKILRRIFGLDQQRDITMSPHLDLDKASPYSWYESQMRFEADRAKMYHLMEEMDTYDLVSGSLDIFAEEATQVDADSGRSVWIDSDNEEIRRRLMDMLDRVEMEDIIYSIARSMVKYGTDFEQVIVDEREGVVSLQYTRPEMLSRVQDRTGRLKGFVAGILPPELEVLPYEDLPDQYKSPDMLAHPWSFIHFRVSSSNREVKHGEPFMWSARRAWRQLKIMEDSIVLYRINRAPDRVVYYIDVGNQPPDQAFQTAHMWRQALTKKFYFNPDSQMMRQEYNPLAIDDEIFWPKKKDDNSSIEILSGSSNPGEIYDLEHFLRKFFAATTIPKASMGFEGDVSTKATLAQQDVRFARRIKRVQRAIRIGIAQLCKVHLALLGIDPESEENRFSVKMTPISYLDDLQRSELYQLRTEMASNMGGLSDTLEVKNKDEWSKFIMRNFLGMTAKEVEKFMSGGGEGDEDEDDMSFGDSEERPAPIRRLLRKMNEDGLEPVEGLAESFDPEEVQAELKDLASDGDVYHFDLTEAFEALMRSTNPDLKCPQCGGESVSIATPDPDDKDKVFLVCEDKTCRTVVQLEDKESFLSHVKKHAHEREV